MARNRLTDSLPQSKVNEYREAAVTDAEFRKKIELYLDRGSGKCWLKRKDVAKIVQDALLFHNGKKYRLIAWVIMPNDVHLLLVPLEGFQLPEILHSIKSYTAKEANKIIGATEKFWQHESFDRYIRNEKHYWAVIRYIENNPVKARLCSKASEWEFWSAFGRE